MSTTPSQNYRRILAIDTATRVQAVALLDGEKLCEHRVQRVAYNHGSSLLKNVDGLLDGCPFELHEVDLFAVGLGPGSFTGLRVGLATAKALSRAVERPIVGVSSLAAIAYTPARTCPQATILAAMDARRREVYAGAYRWEEDTLTEVLEDRAAPPDDWIGQVSKGLTGPFVQVGDGVEKYDVLRDWDAPTLRRLPGDLAAPSAIGVARLGRALAMREGVADRTQLEPNYIRPSDAVLPAKAPGPMPKDPDATK